MADEMRLIIISGLSGSGKTVALHVLEDLGYYCVDNMPAALLKSVVDEIRSGNDKPVQLLAVGVDARNRRKDLESLPELITKLQAGGVQTELLFLQASDDVLLQRYGESRRRHPLAEQGTELRAAIASERTMLAELVNAADLIIDTSRMSIYQLAQSIRDRVDRRKTNSLSVLIESFGFKNGIPADADFVFDLRCLPNPYWTLQLRGLNGRNKEVTDFLEAQPSVVAMYEDILAFLQRWIPEYDKVHRGYLTVAIGCTGGQHRSVFMTDKLATALRAVHDPVLVRHNELDRQIIESQ
ncbi:MAG: RNase adapter RapZ [Gammaproteobacteria bacterium]|nr:RNase adapter RapZ [Gammaproteobacteria bacterium]MDH5303479.1 RNase adapter RapZ [Gammaproteobacteria bacterium]